MKRIAWFSPIALDRPLLSAVYTSILVPALAGEFEIELFIDDPDYDFTEKDRDFSKTDRRIYRQDSLFHYHRFAERDQAQPFDLAVFQLEDDPRLSYVYRMLRVVPGIVYRHDLNLNRMFLSAFRHSTGGTDIDLQMSEQFGHDCAPLGSYAVRNWSIELYDRLYQRGLAGPASIPVSIIDNSQLYSTAIVQGEGSDNLLFIDPPAAEELFSRQLKMKRREGEDSELTKRTIVGLTGGRELEDRVAWCGELFQEIDRRIIQNTNYNFQVKWALHSAQLDRSALGLIERYSADYPWLEVVKTDSTELYLKMIAEFDLYLALKHRAGRGRPFELQYAAACNIPAIISNYGVGSAAESNPIAIVLDPEQGGDAIISTSLIELFLNKIADAAEFPNRTGSNAKTGESEFVGQFRSIIKGQLNDSGRLAITREALLTSQNNRVNRMLVDSTSAGLNANYSKLVKGILTKDLTN